MAISQSSLKGQLLLDNGRLQGSFFHRTVILICQHDTEGALGLVLNRSTGNKVGEALVAKLPETLKQLPLFLGGPVQPQALSFLHSDSFIPNANVMPNLSLDHSLDALVDVSDSYSPSRQLKIFAGYAGWSPGQLDDEMKRDTWLTHPASLELVFHPQPETLWHLILAEMGWKYKLIADAPNQVIELRGTPNAVLPAGTYFLSIEGDTNGNPGVIQNLFDLSGRAVGANGFLVLLQKFHNYTPNPLATVLTNSDTGSGWGSGSSSSIGHRGENGQTELEDASCTFFLVSTTNTPSIGDDIDSDNDGRPDGPEFAGWTILDSVGVLDNGGLGDIAYGAINF